jgi:hypothetical protein
MRLFVVTLSVSIALGISLGISLGAGAARAADSCGVGCHAAVNGGCVVNGWEGGAAVWNECPAGAVSRPPCGSYYSWRRHSHTCMRVN